MGSYYECTINGERHDTHDLNSGLKLMEHSYLNNEYCLAMEFKILNNPSEVVWLCDYSEEDNLSKWTWDTTEEIAYPPVSQIFQQSSIFIVNHTKKVYYNKDEVRRQYRKDGRSKWHINPLPILTNSEPTSMGGGDYHPEDSRRGTWCGDTIEARVDKLEEFSTYTDVSSEVLFWE